MKLYDGSNVLVSEEFLFARPTFRQSAHIETLLDGEWFKQDIGGPAFMYEVTITCKWATLLKLNEYAYSSEVMKLEWGELSSNCIILEPPRASLASVGDKQRGMWEVGMILAIVD